MSTLPAGGVRTFKTRRRKLSASRASAHASLLGPWGLAAAGPPLDLRTLLPQGAAEVVLDLGVGGGESTIEAAERRFDQLLVAIEVHTPGIAAILHRIGQEGWSHVRVVEGDALAFVGRLAHGTVDEIRIFFPDPWPKRRHHRRRLVRSDTLDLLVGALRVGGRLHLATDDATYAVAMELACGQHPSLHGGPVPRPEGRALTRYERRGLAAGRAVADLVYVRR